MGGQATLAKIKNVDWESISVGDKVLMHYTGFPRVPITLDNHWATVKRITKVGKIGVQADDEKEVYIRNLLPSDVIEHIKNS